MVSPVRVDVDGAVATLTLDNPPLNVVTVALTRALDDALRALESAPEVRALVVTGAGERAFCAGSDISEFDGFMAPGRVVPGKLALQNEVFTRLERCPKPTLAAIDGLAFGGGLEIAVCCDLIVAGERARFALPELRLGVFPSSGGPLRVTRRVGAGRAREMMFGGEPIDARTALAWGLVNRVVPAGEALARARAWAAELALRPRAALAACKEVIGRAFDADQDAAMRRSLELSDRAFASEECREGVRAFFAKRSPDFSGL